MSVGIKGVLRAVALASMLYGHVAASASIQGIFLADAHDGRGQLPWQTDGTSTGTVKVAIPYRASSTYTFYPTKKSISIFSYYPGGNTYNIDFLAENGAVTTWNGCPGCILQNFYQLGSDIYFIGTPPGGSDAVYKSSGTSATTTKICDVAPSCGITSGVVLSSVFTFKNSIYYSFIDFGGKTSVYTVNNARFTIAFTAYNSSNTYNDLKWDTQVGDQIIFGNASNSGGSELYATDGTQAGRHLVKSFYSGQTSGLVNNPSIPTKILFLKGDALILATDPSKGTGLWMTDATNAGTKRLTLTRDDAYRIYQNYGRWSQIVTDKLYFVASIDQSRFDGLGQSLYVIDPAVGPDPTLLKLMYQNYEVFIPPARSFTITPNGWVYTPGIQVGSPTCKIVATDNGPNFSGSGCDEKLYRMNLVTKEVRVVADPFINNKTCSNDCDGIDNLTASGNNVLFSASDRRYYTPNDNQRVDNPQPWYTEGSAASSIKLKQIASYLDGGSSPYQFLAMP